MWGTVGGGVFLDCSEKLLTVAVEEWVGGFVEAFECAGARCRGHDSCFFAVEPSAEGDAVVFKAFEEEKDVTDGEEDVDVVDVAHRDWLATLVVVERCMRLEAVAYAWEEVIVNIREDAVEDEAGENW